jgi:FkbM family methyltransferase
MADPHPSGTFTATLAALFAKGLRYATVIDIGCADGHFYLSHSALGLLPGSSVLNIDANPLYEESLRSIRETVGGEYFIGAVTDHVGEVELKTSAHPYWNSLRPADDPYWRRVNNLQEGTLRVPACTLDALAERFRLHGPYLLKLDVQGAETQVLRAGQHVLADTSLVICEADLNDFQSINEVLVAAGFDLFDITNPVWLADKTLGWFYPVYLNRKLLHLKQQPFWLTEQNDEVIKLQADRRQSILDWNASYLASLRAASASR